MKKKVLLSSILTIVLCLSLIAGSTYALFTTDTNVNIGVTAGDLDIKATISSTLMTWSLGETEADNRGGSFANGGVAKIDNSGKLVIDRMTPGDVVKLTIDIANYSDIALLYRVKGFSTKSVNGNERDLFDALVVTTTFSGSDNLEDKNFEEEYVMNKNDKDFVSPWAGVITAPSGNPNPISSFTVMIAFPNGTDEHDNAFQGASAEMQFTVEAVQGNAPIYDDSVTIMDAFEYGGIISQFGDTISSDRGIVVTEAPVTLADVHFNGADLGVYDPWDDAGYPAVLYNVTDDGRVKNTDVTISGTASVTAPAIGSERSAILYAQGTHKLTVERGAVVAASGSGNACINVLMGELSLYLKDLNSLQYTNGASAIAAGASSTITIYVPNGTMRNAIAAKMDVNSAQYDPNFLTQDGTCNVVILVVGA